MLWVEVRLGGSRGQRAGTVGLVTGYGAHQEPLTPARWGHMAPISPTAWDTAGTPHPLASQPGNPGVQMKGPHRGERAVATIATVTCAPDPPR